MAEESEEYINDALPESIEGNPLRIIENFSNGSLSNDFRLEYIDGDSNTTHSRIILSMGADPLGDAMFVQTFDQDVGGERRPFTSEDVSKLRDAVYVDERWKFNRDEQQLALNVIDRLAIEQELFNNTRDGAREMYRQELADALYGDELVGIQQSAVDSGLVKGNFLDPHSSAYHEIVNNIRIQYADPKKATNQDFIAHLLNRAPHK